ncbi:ATP-dependent RecD-like DNA helicase [Paraburkholderia sp. UCT31]|uniref:SF1B family DNA helicase RecD2 n=1 Tax=Paraburkholderia sp. UCT31 TaxID=2615209 RepID=UPI001655D152|nr:ATP-dependent RecD-like DNA helicase [Paraburkholderia sp. UCT31]MBC8737272.1 ATP-dependent RecD-like DNA helicase [Paraburkholderia sp. UCT31]
MAAQGRDVISGTVKNLTFRNEENGYFIAKLDTGDGKEPTAVLGYTPVIVEGEHLEATGTFERSKWGTQFKAASVRVVPPTSLEGIEKYLASGIKGIGKAFAKRLVGAFGKDVFKVIDESPEQLAAVKGIGKVKAQSIVEVITEAKATRSIMVFLHSNGISTARANRIFKMYGEKAVEKIQENPYVLCQDIWGIGFDLADKVARSMGYAMESEFRLRAGIRFAVMEATAQGSCGLPLSMVMARAADKLSLPEAGLDKALKAELDAKGLILDSTEGEKCLFLPKVYNAERQIASKLFRMSQLRPRTVITDIEDKILHAELELGIDLEEAQKEAVRVALENQVTVITGGPGTGKSTITKVITTIFREAGVTMQLVAPTGKASRRLSEASQMGAQTVHKTLGVGGKGQFNFNEHNQLTTDLFLGDEWSMVDVALFQSVLVALPFYTRLVILGDVDQLPSVGPGKVLKDIIDSGVIPTVRLLKPFRQAAKSKIISNAHKVNNGEIPDVGMDESSDFAFVDPGFKEDKAAGIAKMLEFIRDLWKKGYDPIRDVQVLAPLKKGDLGTIALNLALKKMLNGDAQPTLERFGQVFSPGDKVIQKKNSYEKMVFNGDIGYVAEVDLEEKTVTVDFDGNIVVYAANELEELDLAFAITVHKSQGSEFPVVVMPLDSSHYVMLKRNLLYTAMTRAKKYMVVMGTKWAAEKAVENSQIDERYSKLKDWLIFESKRSQQFEVREEVPA